jgi:hypothetical protein
MDLHRELGLSLAAYAAQQSSATQLFWRFQQQFGLHVLKPQDILCGGGRCAIARGEAPLYRDGEHLTITGAMTVAPIFDALFAP